MLFEAIMISNLPVIEMSSLQQLRNGVRESSIDGVSQIEELYQNIDSIYTYIYPNDVEDICHGTRGTSSMWKFIATRKLTTIGQLIYKTYMQRPENNQ